jgi:predicted aspartyl protease
LGETRVAARIFGQRIYEDIMFLVDTGATFTKIPQSLAKKLAIEADETIDVLLKSDGTRRSR